MDIEEDVGEEDDRGYENALNFNDVFLTTWTLIWFIPITIVFSLMIKHRLATKSQQNHEKEPRIWIVGFIVLLQIV